MITVFFNEDGYVVTGDGVDVARRCAPALTPEGDRIFQPVHHTYKVLYLALRELRDMNVASDVMVHNDSRIVDEVNGLLEPLDDTCAHWVRVIRQDIIPTILPVVFFRKKPTTYVNSTIATAQRDMLSQASLEQRRELAVRDNRIRTELERENKRRAIQRLKESWFKRGKTDG